MEQNNQDRYKMVIGESHVTTDDAFVDAGNENGNRSGEKWNFNAGEYNYATGNTDDRNSVSI
jgi:hypothetical protein